MTLSEDGGDELLGGYNRYFWGPRIWNRVAWLPWPLRRWLDKAILTLPPAGWNALARPLHNQQLCHKADKLGEWLNAFHRSYDLYRSLINNSRDPAALLHAARAGWPVGAGRSRAPPSTGPWQMP